VRIAIVTVSRFSRIIVDIARGAKTPTALHVYSTDEGVEAVAREVNAEFRKLNNIEELHAFKELGDCDIGIIALERDSESIAAARILKAMGVPLTLTVVNSSANRDLASREGLRHIIGLDGFITGNIMPLVLSDSWVVMKILEFLDIGVAVHRFWRRGLLGVRLSDIGAALKGKPARFILLDRAGRVVVDESHVVEQGDTLIILGKYSELPGYVDAVDKVLMKLEEVTARRYSEMFPTTPRVTGG